MVKSIKPKKINWTKGMAVASFCLVILIFVIDNIKEPLFGLIDDYATHNFGLNIFIIGPSTLLSFILSLIVSFRIIKYWNIWPKTNSKYIILGLAFPAILIYANLLIVIFSA
jgi:hypothetical protein